MYDIYFIVLVFIISLVVASIMHQPVLRFAKKHMLFDRPEARKLQRHPVPLLGSFVVFSGAMVGALCYWFKHDCSSIIPVQIAMLLMLIIGLWDDIGGGIAPRWRFVIEIVVVLALAIINDYPIDNFHGLWGIYEISPWIAWPLTVFGCVGIINAINMVDGIDGLSSGICIMAFGFYGLLCFYAHDFVRAALTASIIGGLIPFFLINVFGNRSKMFIGDSGTMMLGVALCDIVMSMLTSNSRCSLQLKHTNFCLIAYTLAVLAIPVFDTVRVMFCRIFRGKSPFAPDNSHLHHAFINYGFHHLETSLLEIMLNMMIVGLWWCLYKSHLSMQWQLYVVVLSGIGVCFGLYWMLGRRKRIAKRLKDHMV